MDRFEVHPVNPEKRILQKISQALLGDGVIICPTGSGYSLACHGGSAKGIKRIARVGHHIDPKKMSLVFKDFASLSDFAVISNPTFKYMNPLVPGPYTFILPATHATRKKLGLRRQELGVHFPYTTFVRALFNYYPGPLLTKSLFSDTRDHTFLPDRIPPEIASHVDILADMGPLPINPTTIIDLTADEPILIRQGAGEVTLYEL